MTLEYDGKLYNLQLDKGFGNGEVDVTLEAVKTEINEQLAKISGLSGVTASYTGNVLSITGSKEVKLTAASSSVIDNLNMKVGQTAVSGEIDTTKLTKSTDVILKNPENYITFELNGVTKKINMDNSLTDAASLETYIQGKLDSAYGSSKVTADYDDVTKKFKFSATSETDVFGVSSISSELSNYTGIETGDYNRVNKTNSILESGIAGIKDLATTTLSNGKEGFILNINNTNIEIESTMTVNEAINKINSNAEAGVKVYYSSTTDTFTVKATETGSHKGVNISAGEGTLAQALFGTGVSLEDKLNEGEYIKTVNGEKGIYKLVDTVETKVAGISFNETDNKFKIDYVDPLVDDINNIDYIVEEGT
ncbi:MAG: hypothetical protein K0Q47_1933, partial [Sedimentibacter sp.]|nr:hypothetical protein [Sedimentibacter sp.]